MNNDELKAKIHELCGQKPHTRNMINAVTKAKDTRIQAALDALSSKQLVYPAMFKGKQYFATRKVFEQHFPSLPLPADDPKTLPGLVRIPAPGEGWMHETEVTYVDGYKVTRVSPPADRWQGGVTPGRGAISEDWIARRQGVDVPSRLGGAF